MASARSRANDFQSGRFHNVIRTSGDQVGNAWGDSWADAVHRRVRNNQRFSDRQATVIPRGNVKTQRSSRTSSRTRYSAAGQAAAASRAAGRAERAGGRTHSKPRRKTIAERRALDAQNSDAGGWRRFGSPSGQPAGGQGNQPAESHTAPAARRQAQRNDRPVAQSAGQPAGRAAQRQPWWMAALRQPLAAATARRPEARRPPPRGRSSGPVRRWPVPALYGMPGGGSGRQESLRIAPPVVRERPSYNAPRQSAPSYSAPRGRAPRVTARRGRALRATARRGRARPAPRSKAAAAIAHRAEIPVAATTGTEPVTNVLPNQLASVFFP